MLTIGICAKLSIGDFSCSVCLPLKLFTTQTTWFQQANIKGYILYKYRAAVILITFSHWKRKYVHTRNTAIEIPMRKPAMTSDQWLRYSATLFIPVRNAKHIKPRHKTGLASRVPLALTVLVIYILKRKRKKGCILKTNWKITVKIETICIKIKLYAQSKTMDKLWIFKYLDIINQL